jgi:hypothetical protein
VISCQHRVIYRCFNLYNEEYCWGIDHWDSYYWSYHHHWGIRDSLYWIHFICINIICMYIYIWSYMYEPWSFVAVKHCTKICIYELSICICIYDWWVDWLIDWWIPSVDHGTYGDGGLAQKPWMLNVKLWGGWMSNYLAESKIAHSA